jgi:hypothetical protein
MKLRVRRNGLIGDLNILRDGGVKLNITDATTNIFFKFLVRRNGVTGMKTLITMMNVIKIKNSNGRRPYITNNSPCKSR